jgi:hypothetical protein
MMPPNARAISSDVKESAKASQAKAMTVPTRLSTRIGLRP